MSMTSEARKAAVAASGQTQAGIGRALGVKRAHVNLVLSGARRSERVERAIADAIGQPVEAVFPPREMAAQAA